jgi:lactoylglutathione lyase
MITIKIIGFLAASLTTIAFIPQAYKTWKTKSTHDLSVIMFILLFTGILLWLVYGLLIHDLPIIIANSVTLCFAGVILYYILFPSDSVQIQHVAVWADNIEEMKDFYCEYFNTTASAKYTNEKKQFTSYFLTFPTGSRLEIMNRSNLPARDGNNHFALSLGSRKKVDTLTHQLQNSGIEIVSFPRLTGDGYYESVIKDPAGNLVELTA